MSDLSRLLGDVYRSGPATPAAADETTADEETTGTDGSGSKTTADPPRPATLSGALPEWADESVLDEAFANWVPGPPGDAPQAERGMLTDLAAVAPQVDRSWPADAPPAPIDDRVSSLAEAVPVAPDFIFPQASDAEVTGRLPAPVPGHWQRSDDDLLPARGRTHSWLRR